MAKRSNPVVPWSAPKRRKTMKIKKSQLPRSMIPETKFKDLTTSGSTPFLSNNLRVFQGDDGDDFVGSKVCLTGYDVSIAVSSSTAIYRVSVLVPKDPSISPTSLAPTIRYGHREFTIIEDHFGSCVDTPIIRLKKKLNMIQTYTVGGTLVTHNNLYVVINVSPSTVVDMTSRLYFTDA